MLGEIGQEITRHLDEQVVFDILQAHVHDLLDATHLSVWALNAAGDALEMVFGISKGRLMPQAANSAVSARTAPKSRWTRGNCCRKLIRAPAWRRSG